MKPSGFLILLFLTACTYEPTGSFVKVIPQPTAAGITVTLSSPPSSSLINQPTTFKLQVSLSKGVEFNYQIFIDNVAIKAGKANPGALEFIIDPGNYATGQHTLKIITIVPSGSGSLADKLGREVITSEQSWPLTFDLSPPPPLGAPVPFAENGKSGISITQNVHPSIVDRALVREYLDDNDVLIRRDSVKVTYSADGKLFDDSYIGGKARYRYVEIGYKFKLESGSCIQNVPHGLEVSFDSLSNPPAIKWTKPTLSANSLKISVSVPQLFLLSNGVSTSGSYPVGQNPVLKLGQTMEFEVKLSATNTAYSHSIGFKKVAHIGQYVPKFQALKYVAQKQAFFMISNNKFIRLNGETLEKTGELQFDSPSSDAVPELALSGDGNYAFVQKNTDPTAVLQIDLSAMTISKTINLATFITNPYATLYHVLTVTSNNLLLFKTNTTQHIVDLTNDQVVKAFYFAPDFTLSPNGEFIAWKAMSASGTVFRRNGNEWDIPVGNYPTTILDQGYRAFRQSPGNQFVTSLPFPLSFYDLDTPADASGNLIKLSTSSINGKYDPYANVIINATSTQITVYNASNFSVLKTLDESNANVGQFTFGKNRLFHSDGFATYP